MLRKSETAVLVTGATGFIGQHLVPRLVAAGRRVVVLVRRRAGLSAEQRIAEAFGELSNRLELVEGDLAYPAIIEKDLRRIPSTVHTVIHCAGETSFSADERESTRIVQIDGPLALLRMLAARGLRCWSHVSTAFVCGRRSGIVRENETDVGQEFHNSYEWLKLQSEIAFKVACRELEVELRILRPSIVVGRHPRRWAECLQTCCWHSSGCCLSPALGHPAEILKFVSKGCQALASILSRSNMLLLRSHN